LELLSAAKMRAGRLGHAYEVLRVPPTDRGGLAAVLETFLGVLSNRLEHPVANPPEVFVDERQRLIDELADHVDGVDNVVVRDNRLCRAEIAATGEHR